MEPGKQIKVMQEFQRQSAQMEMTVNRQIAHFFPSSLNKSTREQLINRLITLSGFYVLVRAFVNNDV